MRLNSNFDSRKLIVKSTRFGNFIHSWRLFEQVVFVGFLFTSRFHSIFLIFFFSYSFLFLRLAVTDLQYLDQNVEHSHEKFEGKNKKFIMVFPTNFDAATIFGSRAILVLQSPKNIG